MPLVTISIQTRSVVITVMHGDQTLVVVIPKHS
jgi:hypothetical protein